MDFDEIFEKIVIDNKDFYRCNKCTKTFNKKNNAKRHLNNVFDCSKAVSYSCYQCNKEFNDKSKYNRHIKSCTKKNNFSNKNIQTDDLNINYFEQLSLLYIPKFIIEFMINIYYKYPHSNLQNTINNYFINKDENTVQELFSFLIKKTKDLNTETLFEIYKTIKKNQYNNFINQWNEKLYEEIIKTLN